MMTIRKGEDRGRTNIGWLDSFHSFSFGDYFDPAHHNYRTLRVINDDRITAGGGFPTHPHRDMEIVTVMFAGRLAHKDSLGNVQEIRPGEVQVMTAGTGITHSEFNPSYVEDAHLLQIWLMPERKGLTPYYDQKKFESKPGWQTIASPDGREGSLVIHQDALVLKADITPDAPLKYEAKSGRGLWLQVATGAITTNGASLKAGDGALIEGERVKMVGSGQILLFDLK